MKLIQMKKNHIMILMDLQIIQKIHWIFQIMNFIILVQIQMILNIIQQ